MNAIIKKTYQTLSSTNIIFQIFSNTFKVLYNSIDPRQRTDVFIVQSL